MARYIFAGLVVFAMIISCNAAFSGRDDAPLDDLDGQGGHGHDHGHGHSHGDHGHSHGDAGHSHGHSHGGEQAHGHSHGGEQAHGHSHGGKQDHGHSHGDKQDHGHSHGKPQEPKAAPKEEPKAAPEKPKAAPKEEPKAAPEKPKAAPKEEPKAAPKKEPKAAPKEEPKAAPKEEPKAAPEKPKAAPKEEPKAAPEKPKAAPKEEPKAAPKQDHGHSHGDKQDHGHSHGGKQDHGHSHGDKQDHGHSHGGKEDHGHSHGGKEDHGHSHGGDKQDHGHDHGSAIHDGVDYSKYAHSHSHGDGEHHEMELPSQLHFLIEYADRVGPKYAALVSTAFVSSASLIICMNIFVLEKIGLLSPSNLVTMTAFAAGTLLGDAVLHILPGMKDDQIYKILVGIGILGFFLLEMIISASHGGHGHGHGHAKDDKAKKEGSDAKSISANALLNVVADFMHNFLDGIAVGITYMIGTKQGITSTIAVFVHELPHEIGDFAVLLKGGFTVTKAYIMQLLSACSAFAGCIVAVYAADLIDIREYCVPIVVGNFIYLSLTAMISNFRNKDGNVFFQLVAFSFGLLCMHGITFLE